MACFWASSFEARRSGLLSAIEDERLRTAMGGFSFWLKARRGAQFAALNMQRYLPFLEAINGQWVTLPSYAQMVAHFGAETLRRSRSVVSWLSETEGLVVDSEIRENTSDQRRISKSLQHFPSGIAREALYAYKQDLIGRSVKLRTVRMSLSSALGLLQRCDKTGQTLPDQQMLRLLLRNRPGLHASLSGFVGFLNRHYALALDARFDRRWLAKAARHVAEVKLTELYATSEGNMTAQEWIRAAMAYFHQIKLPLGLLLHYEEQTQGDQLGFAVTFGGAKYWVPGAREHYSA
ncbi:hypothetical protein [Pseudomonas azotoformans]|uniref:hypothetical protein n=1 Tax=Pseudomonas azotoformans TaxID=47878 RepID=UPI00122E021B|nr:hypothetical protein [Pseudomonas azotoformans]UMY49299.1 hypothetical protein MLC69_29145 [Pseudomonas azotoformans]